MAEIDRLTVVWDARFDRLEDKLNKAVRATYGAASKMEKRLDATNDNIGRKFGKGIGSTISNELDGLAGNVGRASTALSGFGAAGVAAAASLGGLLLVMGQIKAAVAFGDEIADSAQKIGVTTDTLQEFRYAIHQVGGETKDADEALGKFTQTLGKAQTGLGKRAGKGFAALGLDPKEFKDVDSALSAVLDRLSRVQSEAQRQSIASALGLEKFIPLAREGAAKTDQLREAARRLGYVMDADLIAKAGEANDKLEDLQQIIDVQLKSAFVDMAPVVLTVAQALADAARAVRELADDIKGAWPVLRSWVSLLKEAGGQTLKNLTGPVGQAVQGASALAREGLRKAGQAQRAKELGASIQNMLAGGPVDLRGSDFDPANRIRPAFEPIFQGSAGGGAKARAAKEAKDTTAQRTNEVEALFRDAERDLINAWQNLTRGADQRASQQLELLDLEKQERDASLAARASQIQADEGLTDAKKKALLAELEKLAVRQGEVDDLKREAIEQDLKQQVAQDRADIARAALRAEDELLALAAAGARTQAERRAIELRRIEIAEKTEREEIRLLKAKGDAASLAEAEARERVLNDGAEARRENARRDTADPAEQYRRDHDPAGAAERFEAITVGAFDNLADGLANAIVYADSLGDVAKNVFRQLVAELLANSIKSGIITPILGAFGFAAGGPVSGPGSSTSDSIPAMLSDGEFVVNAAAAKKHRALLEAINRGGVRGYAQGGMVAKYPTLQALKTMAVPKAAGVTVIQPFHFHAEGAVLTQELLNQANGYADKRATQAAQFARTAARQDSRKAAYDANLNQ